MCGARDRWSPAEAKWRQANRAFFKRALFGQCPRCGKGKLFDGYLNVAKACTACGLDYAMFDAGDGPAVFVILIVGAIVAGGALYVEFTFQPPYWVHAVLWLPLIVILTSRSCGSPNRCCSSCNTSTARARAGSPNNARHLPPHAGADAVASAGLSAC